MPAFAEVLAKLNKPRFSAKHYYEQMQRYLDEAQKHYKSGDKAQGDQYYAMHKSAKSNYYRKMGKNAAKIKIAASSTDFIASLKIIAAYEVPTTHSEMMEHAHQEQHSYHREQGLRHRNEMKNPKYTDEIQKAHRQMSLYHQDQAMFHYAKFNPTE